MIINYCMNNIAISEKKEISESKNDSKEIKELQPNVLNENKDKITESIQTQQSGLGKSIFERIHAEKEMAFKSMPNK